MDLTAGCERLPYRPVDRSPIGLLALGYLRIAPRGNSQLEGKKRMQTMKARTNTAPWNALVVMVVSITMLFAATGFGQRHDSAGSSDKSSAAEPYGGQLYCPVTGTK